MADHYDSDPQPIEIARFFEPLDNAPESAKLVAFVGIGPADIGAT
jgi:hypothetical protein